MVAKTCGGSSQSDSSNGGNRTIIPISGSRKKVAYSLIDTYHNLCLDKKDIIQGELHACKKLLDSTIDDNDRVIIENEISELKMTLDL
ncbi:MAG: hypothetical protein ACRD8Z_12650, partial [Nitrososphaeraceae archaeon]